MDYQEIEITEQPQQITTSCEFDESIIPYIYKLWKVQGYRNLVLIKLYPIIQTLVIAILVTCLIYLDYSLFFGIPLTTLLSPDGTLPSFFDFFQRNLLKDILFGIVVLIVVTTWIYRGYKMYRMLTNKELIQARRYFNSMQLVKYGGDLREIIKLFSIRRRKKMENSHYDSYYFSTMGNVTDLESSGHYNQSEKTHIQELIQLYDSGSFHDNDIVDEEMENQGNELMTMMDLDDNNEIDCESDNKSDCESDNKANEILQKNQEKQQNNLNNESDTNQQQNIEEQSHEDNEDESSEHEELIDITMPEQPEETVEERNNKRRIEQHRQLQTQMMKRKQQKQKTYKQVHLFLKSCSLVDNFMSSMVNEYDSILRPSQSSYTLKMIKEIFFPQQDINFYKSIIRNETENDMFTLTEWKKHVDQKVKKYERHHSVIRLIPTVILNVIKILMHYFGVLLTPSNLFTKQYTLYAKYFLRRKYSLPHQTEVDLKNSQLLLDGIISLTQTNQFTKAVLKSVKLFVVGAFVIIFMLNIRSEFQIFGISSAVISNLLLTIVVVCYNSSEKEVFERTYTVGKRELVEMFPNMKLILEYQQPHQAIDTITTSLYKPLLGIIIDEMKAPFIARKVLMEFKNYEYGNKYDEIIKKVIQPVLS